ncbi:hypothetical protein [Paragemmobacter straminiformis]|uniref:Uncharacterized protein n=1 Tax=Paragemmobacter straminiformis TaxID=2045119 RepID=A0A842IDK9_9RHOB|nr:hypothetical protein [Gemmobacter straminiformis]MBC2837651.1 hypothetical protein [Gemmobacter straminiformis]
MEGTVPFAGDWQSVDSPAPPQTGWYAVLRVPQAALGNTLRTGAAYFGDDGWGSKHDIFARSISSFDDHDVAAIFARTNHPF